VAPPDSVLPAVAIGAASVVVVSGTGASVVVVSGTAAVVVVVAGTAVVVVVAAEIGARKRTRSECSNTLSKREALNASRVVTK